MDSDRGNPVPPTSVRLYHRHDAGKNHHPTSWKTPTDFPQKACLVLTNNNRHELQIWDGPETRDRGSSDGAGSPRNVPGLDPGSQLTFSIDLKTIKSCVFKDRIWIEITGSSSEQCRAVEFDKEDHNHVDFYERLMTLLKLIGVKCSTKTTIDRAKWFPTLPTAASRQLPPVPTASPCSTELPSGDEPVWYDYCSLNRKRGCRESNPDDWPKNEPPPPPPKTPQNKSRQTPEGEDKRCTTDYVDTVSFSNSTNSMISSNRGSQRGPRADPESNDHYLPLIDLEEPRYLNDRPFDRNHPRSGQKVKPRPKGTSDSDWNCSDCTFLNSSTNYSCAICNAPRRSDADHCEKCSSKSQSRGKGTSSCEEYKSAAIAKTKSLDSNEFQRTDNKMSSSNNDRIMTTGPKQRFEDCEECVRSGSRDRIECEVCRMEAVIKSNSLDGDEQKRLERKREEECHKRISILTVAERQRPTRKAVEFNPCIKSASAATLPAFEPPTTVNVDKWRCNRCTYINPANTFCCEACYVVRGDAWQCQVCEAVICMDVVRCKICDVWRCRLCTFQNDARENSSRTCHQCQQLQ